MTRLCTAMQLVALAGFLSADGFASALPPIWVSDFGTRISDASGLTSSAPGGITYGRGLLSHVSLNLNPGFPFFGSVYQSVTISTTGFIAFTGSNIQAYASATDANMAHSSVVRIAPAWWDGEVIDNNPADHVAGIYLNTGIAGQAIITFANMTYAAQGYYPASNELSTFQVILYQNGTVEFGYQELNNLSRNVAQGIIDNSLDGAAQVLIGLANNQGDSGYSNAQLVQVAQGQAPSFSSCDAIGCHSTVYQAVANQINVATGPGIQLSGANLVFTPTAGQTWAVSDSLAVPEVPEPATWSGILTAFGLFVFLRRKFAQS